jgi:PAS domain S-box-containing protein
MLKAKFTGSIAFKFLKAIFIILLVSALVLSAVIAINEERLLDHSLAAKGRSMASFIGNVSQDPLVLKDNVRLDAIVNEANKDEDILYTVIHDVNGNLITSKYASINYRSPRLSAILSKLPKGLELKEIIDAVRKKEAAKEISLPILIDVKTIGTVTVGLSMHEIRREVARTIAFVLALNLVVAVALGIVLFYFSRKIILTPISMLADAAARLAKGDLSTQVRVETTGELRMLAESFNRMAGDIEKTTVSKNYMNNIFRSMVDTLIIVTPDGTIRDCNDAICRLLEYEENDLIGKPMESILGGDSTGGSTILDEVREKGSIRNREIHYAARNGQAIPMLLSASPMLDGIGRVERIVFVAQDITYKLEMEEQLRQSQKMEAVGKLAGGIAHDFNNLLTAITGYSELILADLPGQGPVRREVEEIRKAADRASALTKQLLAFSRKQAFQMKVVNLNSVISNMDKMLRRLISEDIDLRTRLSEDLGSARVDPGQIEQVIVNIVVNARDAMPEGGRLTVETANVELDETFVRKHVVVKPGPFVMIAISDTGCGMDEATQARIFEPFFTTKSPGKGTGLGLSTVYGIVKQSAGYIWVYSEPERGTTFKVYLPRTMDEVEKASPVHETTDQKVGGGPETILLAEDEDLVRDLITEILKPAGYSVLLAHDGEEALRISEEHKGTIHLLITDVVMPRLNGRDLVSRIQPSRPQMKVIYMSGYTENAILHHGVLEAGIHFIQKPFRPGELSRKIREVLDAPLTA